MAPHSNAERMRNPSFRHTNINNGFSLVELTIIISIVGILSSITLVNLSRSWASQRLLASTRELENWLGEQRRFAMRQNLTCKVMIDHANKRLISTIDSGNAATPCSDDPSAAGAGIFDLAESFGSGSDKLELLSTPSTRPDDSDGGIRFSFRGFSQNHQLSSEGRLEWRLRHRDLTSQRCIRIVSPIGMMRDGLATDESSPCRYDSSY